MRCDDMAADHRWQRFPSPCCGLARRWTRGDRLLDPTLVSPTKRQSKTSLQPRRQHRDQAGRVMVGSVALSLQDGTRRLTALRARKSRPDTALCCVHDLHNVDLNLQNGFLSRNAMRQPLCATTYFTVGACMAGTAARRAGGRHAGAAERRTTGGDRARAADVARHVLDGRHVGRQAGRRPEDIELNVGVRS